MHPFPTTITGYCEHCSGMMRANLQWSGPCFQIDQGKIWLIQSNMLSWPSQGQTQTVWILLRKCDGIFVNWSCSEGIGYHAIMIREMGECSGVQVIPADPQGYTDSLGSGHEFFVDWLLTSSLNRAGKLQTNKHLITTWDSHLIFHLGWLENDSVKFICVILNMPNMPNLIVFLTWHLQDTKEIFSLIQKKSEKAFSFWLYS